MRQSSKAIDVLIVTADPADGDHLAALLRDSGFDPRAALAQVGAPVQALLHPGLDLILADLSAAEVSAADLSAAEVSAADLPAADLPAAGSGRGWIEEALALLKQRGLRIPLVVIADPRCEAQAAALLDAGAADYLCKDRLARLGAVARRAVCPGGDEFRLEEEARYRLLFEHAHDIFLFVRLGDGRILEANRAAERAYGYTRAELLEMPIAGLRAPETRAQIQAQLEQVRTLAGENQGLIFETLHRRKDGSTFPVEVHSLGVSIDGEKVSLSIIRDISQRKAAEQALERRMVELEALNELARAGAEATSLDELIRRVVGIVRQRLYPDEFGVALLDESRGTLTFHSTAYTHLTPEQRTFSWDIGITGSVARSGKPMRVGDVRLSPVYYDASPQVRSALCVPLLIDHHVAGVLSAESKVQDFFTAADEQLLVAIAGGMAAAMEKIRMRETEHKRLEELESLAEISREQMERLTALRSIDRSILSAPDLEQTLAILLQQFTKLLKVDAVQILLYDHRHQMLLVTAEKGMPEQPLYRKKVAFENTHAGQVSLKRQMEFIPDLAQVDDAMTQRLNKIGAGFTSYLAMPLVAKDEVKGVVEIFQKTRLGPAPDWMNFLRALVDQAAIAIDNALLFKEQQQTTERLREAYEDTIDGWSRVLDMRDKETEGHSRRVTELTMKLARRLGASPEQLAHIRRGAQLHDIGKMGIPDNILLKPGPLNTEEWAIMRKHPLYALDFLYPIEFLTPALEIPYCHHEKWDGTGYPQGLRGEQIPLAARIFAVVDVWDALTSERPYRQAWPREQAIAYIREQTRKSFDPRIVEQFLEILAEDKALLAEDDTLQIDEALHAPEEEGTSAAAPGDGSLSDATGRAGALGADLPGADGAQKAGNKKHQADLVMGSSEDG